MAQQHADLGVQSRGGGEDPESHREAKLFSGFHFCLKRSSAIRGSISDALEDLALSYLKEAPLIHFGGEDMNFIRPGDHLKDWILWGAGNKQQLGSEKSVLHEFGYKPLLDMERPSNISSMNSTTEFGMRVLHCLQNRGQNNSSSLNIESNLQKLAIGIDLMAAKKLYADKTSQKFDYYNHCNLNKHKESMTKDPMFQPHDTFNQQKRKEIAQHVSDFVFFTILCLWFLLETCSLKLNRYSAATLIHVQPLHREHRPVSVGVPFIGLFGFIAVVWAVAMMILVGAKFTRLHKAVFLFWSILMLVRPSTFQHSGYI